MRLMRRLVQAVATVFLIATVSFVLVDVVPGRFHDTAALENNVNSETIHAWRQRVGENRSFAERYAAWLTAMLRGDMGESFAYQRPVSDLLHLRAKSTLGLTASALTLTWIIGVVWGLVSSYWAGWPDHLSSTVAAILLSVPEIVMGFVLLALALHWGGGESWTGFALPLITLILTGAPSVWRQSRASLLQAQNAYFVRAALAHGVPRWRLLWRWTLPVAANPLISMFGLSVGNLLSASLVVEVIFGRPGIGPLFLDAIANRDTYVVLGVVVTSAVCLVAGNLIADTLLFVNDPRIRQ